MSETPIRGDTAERALLTMPAGAVNEEVRAATEESMAILMRFYREQLSRGANINACEKNARPPLCPTPPTVVYVTPSVGGATTKSLGLWLAGSLRARKCCVIAQMASRPTQQPKAVATPMSLSSTTSTTALSGTR